MKVCEKEFLDEISLNEMWRNIEFLSSFDKTSGTEGEYKAVEYLKNELDKYGIKNTVYEINGYLSYPISGRVEIVSEENRPIEAKTRSFSAKTPPEGVSGEIIYIPGGKDMYTDTETKKRIEQLDLTGKIVLSEGGGRQNMILAQQKGAVGYIHMWPSDEDVIHEGIVTPVWGTPTPEKLDSIPTIPVLSIKNKDGVKILEKAKKKKVVVRMFSETETGWRKEKLLEASIPGETNEFLLIAGHIDSWHLGATDNVTGNVVCLELARLFEKYKDGLKRGVKIAWWPGHSTGRYSGSTWYCDNFWFDLHKNCIAYINIDSPGPIGANDYSEVTAAAETSELALRVVKEITGQEAKWVRPMRAADQSFWGPGVSSVYMLMANRPKHLCAHVGGSGKGWWWHTEEDTIDKIGKEELLKDCKIYALTALRLCTSEILPLDVKNTAHELCEIVNSLDAVDQQVFDLGPVKEALNELTEAASNFAEAGRHLKDKTKVEKYNKQLLSALRYLTQINYTYAGAFEHDPAVPSTPLPLLDDVHKLPELTGNPDIGFILTKLVRNRNKVVYHINKATKELEWFI